MARRGKTTCRPFLSEDRLLSYRSINSRRIPWLLELLIDYEIRIDHAEKKTHGCNKSHGRMNRVDIIFFHLYRLHFSHSPFSRALWPLMCKNGKIAWKRPVGWQFRRAGAIQRFRDISLIRNKKKKEFETDTAVSYISFRNKLYI